MGRIMDEDLIYQILSVVEEIPEGRVASYGQIARLIGRERNSRLVGKVLSMAEFYGHYPCHRVVNHAGRLAPGFFDQRSLLLEEGVGFKENGCVDMKKYQWEL
ncbi:MAG: MGMT family protein [Firmicutes bacterium]|nr:MGMT family protein [Bacillota bacterium]